MAVKEREVEVLREAFNQFNASSFELGRSYRLLKREVRRLKSELKESHLEKERYREEAERNHRLAAVGEMAARMAHELRNPLGSIELFASLLRKELSKDPEKREWAEHLSTAVRSIDYAITNLLLFTSKPIPQMKKVDLKMTIESIRPFVKHMIQQNNIEWIEACDRRSETTWCDEDLLRQVLLNLILNAIDAMPQGGSLKISTALAAHNPEKVEITVIDSGPGISKETLPHIFDPFFTTKDKGTGLGLSIVQNAISAHKGSIRVESSANGTEFIIHLPLNSETE